MSTLTVEPTGRLLLHAFRYFEIQVLQGLNDAGYQDISLSHLNLIRHLEPRGMRMSHLAQDAALSKQAVGKIAKDLAEKGYIRFIQDKKDARAKLIKFTGKGNRMVDKAIAIVIESEDWFMDILGNSGYQKLREYLEKIIKAEQK